MPKDDRIGVGVCSIVLRDDLENDETLVLLGLRRGSHCAGLWSGPGGWLEFGETLHQAALRELFQETGLSGAKPRVFHAGSAHDYKEQWVTVYVDYPAGVVVGDPVLMEPDKCERWKWFKTSELPEQMFPGVEEAIDLARARHIHATIHQVEEALRGA